MVCSHNMDKSEKRGVLKLAKKLGVQNVKAF